MIVNSSAPIGKVHPIGSGLGVFEVIQIDAFDEDISCDIKIEARYDVELGRFVADTITVRRRQPGTEITGTDLRAIKVQECLRRGIRPHIMVREEETKSWRGFQHSQRVISKVEAAKLVAGGPTESALQVVAHVYRMAEVLNQPPAKAVVDEIGLTARTAANWIKRARVNGLLPSTAE